MKKNIILICLILAAVFTGCVRDDSYDAPNSFSDVGWIFSDVNGPLDTNIGDYITFTDASQGYSHHEWEIGEGNFYLEHPLGRNDRGDSILRPKIIGSGTTSDNTVSVFFDKPGLQPVRLFNVFPDSVGYRASDDYRAAAERVGDSWVIDTTFLVDVYARMRPKVQVDHANGTESFETGEAVNPNGNNTVWFWNDTSSFKEIIVEAGDAVDFTDLTEIGRPETTGWKIISAEDANLNNLRYDNEGRSIGGGTNISHTFSSLGDYYIGIRVSRDSENIPNASSSNVIPFIFKVVPSSKPFEILGDVAELEDETIRVPFNGEFLSFTNHEQFFTVNVNGTPFNIESVTPNGTFLDIKLTDPIYRPDVITVTYDGNGTFTSTDTRSPVAFTDVPVVMHNVNLLEGDMVNSDISKVNNTWFEAQSSGRVVLFSTEQFVSGPTSAKHTLMPTNNTAGMRANLDPALSTTIGKEYTFSFKMYIDPSSTVLPRRVGVWDIPRWSGFSYNFTGSEPKGQWIDVEITLGSAVNANISAFLLRSDAATGNTSDCVIYYDDFHVVEKEVRP